MAFHHRSTAYADLSSTPQGALALRSYDSPVLLVVAPHGLLDLYPTRPYTRILADSSPDALRAIRQSRPHIIAIDWDVAEFDAPALCRSIEAPTAILVTTGQPEAAPAALKAGCHSILLKPLTPSLIAGRIGRLNREASTRFDGNGGRRRLRGTNTRWGDAVCPRCGSQGPTSFEFSSHRRAWYACLSCDAVWLGPRRE